MYDTTKVKTYTPIIPAGTGPTFTIPEDAIREMITDLDDQIPSGQDMTSEELEKFVRTISKGLDIADWIDGEYDMFPDYALRIETMAQGRFDEMPEFNGY